MEPGDVVIMGVRIAKATRDDVKVAAIRLGTTMEAFVTDAVMKALAESQGRIEGATAN